MSEYVPGEFGYKNSTGEFIAIPGIAEISMSYDDVPILSTCASKTLNHKDAVVACNLELVKRESQITNMFKFIVDYKVYNKTTVVYFIDGTKETVVCSDEDTFDAEQGIIMCVIKRMFGDDYKKSVRSVIKAKIANEKALKKQEEADKEARLREEKIAKKNRENKLRMKARYEARLSAAIEEEKKKLKK